MNKYNAGQFNKYTDVVQSDLQVLTYAGGGTSSSLIVATRGTDATQYVGHKVLLHKLVLSCLIRQKATGTGNLNYGEVVRIIVVYDKQTSGTAPAMVDLLSSANLSSDYKVAGRDRYVFLVDEMFTFGAYNLVAGALNAGSPQPVVYKTEVDLKGMPWIVDSAGGVTTGHITLVYASKASGTQTFIDVDSRIYFSDV